MDGSKVTVAYHFGVQTLTVQQLPAEGTRPAGLYLVLTAAVENGNPATPADYLEGTVVEVLRDGVLMESATVIDSSETGRLVIAIPYAEVIGSGGGQAFKFTVKAVKE